MGGNLSYYFAMILFSLLTLVVANALDIECAIRSHLSKALGQT